MANIQRAHQRRRSLASSMRSLMMSIMGVGVRGPIRTPCHFQIWHGNFTATTSLSLFGFSLLAISISAYTNKLAIRNYAFSSAHLFPEIDTTNVEDDALLAPAPAPEIEFRNDEPLTPPPTRKTNERLKKAYVAFQAWKKAIHSDPLNITGNWVGEDVCSYNGVYCAPALDDPTLNVVAGIDLNNADIAGSLPEELGHLQDIALFHINSNRFCGVIPESLLNLTLVHEYDISNNRFVGRFPSVVLTWPNLKYLDLRFNDFEGPLPPELFEKDLDAIFLNNNRFSSFIPDTIGKSNASVITFAYNNFKGCIPSSFGNMKNLNEIVFVGNNLGGCFPQDVGKIENLTVLDLSDNGFEGTLPNLSGLKKVEVIDVSHNKLSGYVSNTVCQLPSLKNFTFSHNYFYGEAQSCVPSLNSLVAMDDSYNCLSGRKDQNDNSPCGLQQALWRRQREWP
ncbi:hypothetical protein V8G54_014779 [Vigna mungo]|uniref:Cell wall hydroxyproline-rich glycoprotein n=1 Tax=Vigna mungo TaxID=3915 RepID=A0AAQ3RZS5_VIGMU